MNQLQILIDMIADLPEFALWIVAAFFIYKVIIIGSIYGVVKLAITKLYAWASRDKVVNRKAEVNGMCMGEEILDQILTQLRRLTGKHSAYLHAEQIHWLAEAITEKEERESQEELGKPPATE